MELKRQQQQQTGNQQPVPLAAQAQAQHRNKLDLEADGLGKVLASERLEQDKARRVRGRRSSKPMMEKRRRARINQCLDTLKSYVLTDSNNLSRLGIDTSLAENHDEEKIARTILKSSGLIHRHRGRKNPNKLEKADILELTVDYVRRLHEQRDQLMVNQSRPGQPTQAGKPVPVQLLDPLRLELELEPVRAAPPSPPPSSASSSPQPLLALSSNVQPTGVEVLDLSDSKRARSAVEQAGQPTVCQEPFYKDGLMLVEDADGCWRPRIRTQIC